MCTILPSLPRVCQCTNYQLILHSSPPTQSLSMYKLSINSTLPPTQSCQCTNYQLILHSSPPTQSLLMYKLSINPTLLPTYPEYVNVQTIN
jgi:hypothetical protein